MDGTAVPQKDAEVRPGIPPHASWSGAGGYVGKSIQPLGDGAIDVRSTVDCNPPVTTDLVRRPISKVRDRSYGRSGR